MTMQLDEPTVTVDEILDFWFGELDADGLMSREAMARWWRKDPGLDAEIRRRFGDAVEAAAAGLLDDWAQSPRGAIALLVLLDQFSRNIYRDTPGAFAQDARARRVAGGLLDGGQLEALPDAHRYLALMPWMHSEDRDDHAVGQRLWQQAVDEASSERARELFAAGLDFEQRHAVIVERFGRYPHRNAILGRESTPEEIAFLEQPGSSF